MAHLIKEKMTSLIIPMANSSLVSYENLSYYLFFPMV